jgi:hypothetical protein
MDRLIPPAVMYGLARDILRTDMGKRIEQRRAVDRDSSEGVRLTKEIATLVQLGQDLDEETARRIIAAGRAAVEERLAPPQLPRVDVEGLRARYPGLLSDDAQVRLGTGWSEILEEALEALKGRAVAVWVAREHCAGLRMMIGPAGEWRAAEFNLAVEVTERAWAKSLQVCETCGRQSVAGPWSRYRTRCADHAEVR